MLRFLFCITGFLLIAGVVGNDNARAELPRCEPRATTDPGRLNIDTEAKQHGALAPCESLVSLYIAQNSTVRSIQARVALLAPDGEVLNRQLLETELRGPEAGLYRGKIRPAAVESHACRQLTLELERLRCADETNRPIKCPSVRLKESFVLAGLSARGPDLDLCISKSASGLEVRATRLRSEG